MPMLSMATMAMDTIWDMPTMDSMDTHMPTVDTTMARDLLMLSQRLRLMLMLCTDTTDMPTTHTPMDTITDTLTMVTTDTHTDMPTGLRCVQELRISFCEVGFIPSHKDNRLQNC